MLSLLKSWYAPSFVHDGMRFLSYWFDARLSNLNSGNDIMSESFATWQRPFPPDLKCNVDGVISQHGQRVGMGCVVRDLDGAFVAARCYSVSSSLLNPM